MRKIILLTIFFAISVSGFGNEIKDTIKVKKEEEIKKGWTFGAIPALAIDSDIGFLYGGVVNFFYYGDGTTYPRYWHSIYLEWTQTTKGSGVKQIRIDSDSLFKKVRTFAEFSYLTENLLDFYGFNGYESPYSSTIEDTLSRLFYRQERKMFRVRTDLLGKIGDSKFQWFAGFEHFNVKLDTINLGKVNKGKDTEDIVPATNGGLYGDYQRWGLIPADQIYGGKTTLLKAGLVYDTRDNEANPNRGMWTEGQLIFAPGFLGNDYAFSKFVIIHRQYITLFPKRLTFAYRVSYQGKIGGEIPTYSLPFIFNSIPSLTRDGLGGSKTIRGVKRNRVVGEDYLFSNLELRWKCYKTVVLKQNFYVSWNFFFDSGMVLRKYNLQKSTDPEAILYLSQGKEDGLHNGAGSGLRLVLNDNFIVSFDYAFSLRKDDGDTGFYMGLNFLF